MQKKRKAVNIKNKNLLTIIFLIFSIFDLFLYAQHTEITSLINDGKYEDAVSKLKKQLDNTKDVEQISLIYNQIGEIQFEYLHDYRSALETYQSILELSKKGLSKDEVILSLMKIGDLYCRIGEYDKAVQNYEYLIKNYPQKNLSVRIVERKIRDIKTALSKLEIQKEIIRKANTKQGEDIVRAHFQIAELLRTSLNNPEKAIERYEMLLEQYPCCSISPEAQWRIGYIYEKVLNSDEHAIESYENVVTNYPTSSFAAEALFRIGRIYKESGNYEKALDAFSKLIDQWPDFWKLPAIFYWKGQCLEEIRNYSQAIDAYKIFLTTYLPQTEQTRLGDIGRYNQSKLKIETEIENKINFLQAEMPKVEWEKARTFIKEGNYSEALPIYRRLPMIAPNSKWAQEAIKQIRKIEYLASIQRLKQKISSLPPGDYCSMIAQERIAEIYERELKEYNKAISEYKIILSDYPKNIISAKTLYRIGNIYAQRLQEQDKARDTYNQLIKDFPNTPEASMANYRIAEIYTYQGKYKEAISAYENVLKSPSKTNYIGNGYVDSFDDRAQFQIGKIYYQKLGDLNSSKNVFNYFVKERHDSPRLGAAYVFLALISEEQKEYDKSGQYLQKAIDLLLNNGSIQSEMIANEISMIDFPDKNPMTILKYLRDKVNLVNSEKGR